jgi:hypothetical protein
MGRRRRNRSEEGTSALELVMTISIIFFLKLAVIQVSLISVTKLITNYAAWSAARVWAVNKDDAVGKAKQAGKSILEIVRWVPIEDSFIDVQEENQGVEVNYETTLGIPFLLKNNQAGRITTRGWGAVPRDPNGFTERGDNKE